MALQIRRGLEADRLSITPLEGELIYVTDTGNIYVGDGTTAGGGLVSGEVSNDGSPQLGGDLDLNGNDIIGNGNINIDGIITATGNINLGDEASDNISVLGSLTTSIIPKLDANVDVGSNSNRWRNGYFTGLEVNGQIDAESINGDLIADDSTVVFNASTGKILASAVEGTFNIDSVTGDLIGSVFADNSTLLVDGVNAVIPGEVISGTITGNLVGVVTGSLTGDVTGNVTGNVVGNLSGNSEGTHTGDVSGSIFADDSTLLVDAINAKIVAPVTSTGLSTFEDLTTTGTVTLDSATVDFNLTVNGSLIGDVVGTVTGNLDGDVQGSIFSDNSTIMLDGINRTLDVITATADIVSTPLLKVDNIVSDSPSNNNIIIENPENAGNFTLEVNSTDGYTTIELGKVSAGDLTGDGGSYGKLNFTRRDTNGTVVTSQIWGGGSDGGIYLASDSNGLPSAQGSFVAMTWEEGKLGLGTFSPQHTLDVRGNGVFTGPVEAASFKGSLVTDASTTIIDGINGSLLVANVDFVGETGSSPADTGTVDSWLEIVVNGNTKYIPLYD